QRRAAGAGRAACRARDPGTAAAVAARPRRPGRRGRGGGGRGAAPRRRAPLTRAAAARRRDRGRAQRAGAGAGGQCRRARRGRARQSVRTRRSGWRDHHAPVAARAAARRGQRLQRRLRPPAAGARGIPPVRAVPAGPARPAFRRCHASEQRGPELMHPKLRTGLGALALVAVSAAATTAVVLPQATAQVSESATPAPQLVQGLPDFTLLVDRVGPAVVNIDATHEAKPARTAAYPDEDQIPEIFRRFFGPGMPFPMPGPGSRMPSVSQGSGFIISTDGYVLTNHHVIDGADEVTVKLSDSREFTAKVVGSDEKSDVALLKIDAKGLPTLRVGDSHQLKPGQWVVAIGSPFGLDHSVTAGIVSAVGRSNRFADQQYVPFIQTDVAINRGNSGGPLLNTRGEVVGINSQIFSNSGGYMGVSFAIPIDMAMNVVQQLKETGKVQYGMIGVGLQAITREIADGMGLPDTRGALIRNVNPGTPGD